MPRPLMLPLALAGALHSLASPAQTPLAVDAREPVAAPVGGHFRMGTAVSPQGQALTLNNRYLSLAGQPVLPVMGEFHYTRSPADSWEDELRKMKSAGITMVASYLIWNHHEAQDGRFDWSGNRDLRRFVQLCQKLGLQAVVRVGPWAHAEVRYGGIPDWVVDRLPTRRDDPEYLALVERFYAQIAQQLRGLLWKDGGPVVGVQLENEYNLGGPGQGAQHIRSLKALAQRHGLDVPLYTVTGWDGALYPSGEVTPVFGGYPDEPWGTSTRELPPKETYAFRFDSRVSGDLGAQTVAHARGTAETDIPLTPFFGAEYGAGLPAMYRRRTLVSPDDIAAMVPVQLGSGVNLLGYYMFHGGRNPRGPLFLEESTLSGGYNDTPRISYDFQAPLGPDGQQREVLQRLRPFHYFLQDFGPRLATMTVRKPAQTPANAGELKTLRWALRSEGERGFLFVNNHVRQYAMPSHVGVRFDLQLPGQRLSLPHQPVTVADGQYFIWPVNLDLDGVRLAYATAMPLARLEDGEGVSYVFAASPGMPLQLALDARPQDLAPGARVAHEGGLWRVDGLQPGLGQALAVSGRDGRRVRLMVLAPEQVQQLAIGEFAGQRRLVISAQQTFFGPQGLSLRATGAPDFRVAIYPALARAPRADAALQAQPDQGLFQVFAARREALALPAAVPATLVREAGPVPPVMRGGLAKAALQPIPEAHAAAAAWRLALPAIPRQAGLDEVLLEIDFVGDIGRLFDGSEMLDDWYYNGQHWQLGLRGLALTEGRPLQLNVLPLRADAPIYIDRAHRPDFASRTQLAQLRSVTLKPVYRLELTP